MRHTAPLHTEVTNSVTFAKVYCCEISNSNLARSQKADQHYLRSSTFHNTGHTQQTGVITMWLNSWKSEWQAERQYLPWPAPSAL